MATDPRFLTLTQLNKALPKETAAAFKIVGMKKRTSARFVTSQFGLVNLRTLSIQRAEQLVKQGAPFIERKESKKAKSE